MNVLEMLKKQIQAEGGDGLFNERMECGCGLADLAPCEEVGHDCVLAQRGSGNDFYDYIMCAKK
jgi:hypothetical protein